MLTRIKSAYLFGCEGGLLEIEISLSRGLPGTIIVGLPDAAVKESRDRVRSAIQQLGEDFPLKKITVNLAPADIRKEGPLYDLPIALGILLARENLSGPEDLAIVGELALDGRVRPIKGAFALALLLMEQGVRRLMLPWDNADEIRALERIIPVPVETLAEAREVLTGQRPPRSKPPDRGNLRIRDPADFSEVQGLEVAKRALTIAAAGGHNVLMVGPPGVGKTLLARRIPSLLPPLDEAEALEVTRLHSLAGQGTGDGLLRERPFRAPHHSVTDAALVGGGVIPRPGEISLAHRGVLFLDELPEFRRGTLEALRQPLEERRITICRSRRVITFPASIMLVAALNPCPCGHRGDPRRACRCRPQQVVDYQGRLSGPLLDRIDLHLEIAPPQEVLSYAPGRPSSHYREQVLAARQRQVARYAPVPGRINALVTGGEVEAACRLSGPSQALARSLFREFSLSLRGLHALLRVGRTIADLEGREEVEENHLLEAASYRVLDRGGG